MGSRVFISCGQRDDREQRTAARLKGELTKLGFEREDIYVAIQAQSIEDVNSGIIAELQRADYYVFVDFARERVERGWRGKRRGSLFTHQELTIAKVSGFERELFFQEKGVKLEGLMRYMAANAASFDSEDELVNGLRAAFQERGWRTDYSRHLVPGDEPVWSKTVIRTRRFHGSFLFMDIYNKRPDLAAFDTTARLEFIERQPDGPRDRCHDPTPLKVTGQGRFDQIIWPDDHGAFDLLLVDLEDPRRVFLNSAVDAHPQPIIREPGCYALEYAVLAKDFPALRFTINLEVTGELKTAKATLRKS
jgi:hypothetical protein